MAASDLPPCGCDLCQQGVDHPEREMHRQTIALLSRLDQNQRRWFVAHEAQRLGYGGDGCWPRSRAWTKRRFAAGIANWRLCSWASPSIACGRRVAAGQRLKKRPALEPALTALVEPETAGNPMSAQKWVRSSLRRLSTRLTAQGHAVSHQTVGRLLDQLGYALHVNAKKLEASARHPDRNAQFEHIATHPRRLPPRGGRPSASTPRRRS